MRKRQKTLRDLHAGQSGIVESVGGEAALRRRLTDLGLTPGCRVLVRRFAPLGDPIQLSLRGYELSLRRVDARNIVLRSEE